MKLPGTSLRAYAHEARDAFVHAPVEVLMGVALALSFSVALRSRDGEDWWLPLFAAGVLALPLVFGASVLRARGVLSAGARWGATAAALASAGAYAAWVFSGDLSSERWRAASLAAAAWLALLLVPAIGGGGDEGARRARVWRFDALLVQRILAVGMYGAALFAALAGAVAAVQSLFELSGPEHLYQDIAGAVFFALVPWVVAGGVPALVAEGGDGPARVTVRRVGRYLYAVVLVVYLAILFAYTLKVVATGDLPKNFLCPIVLFAGLAGLLGGIVLEPLQDDPESRGVARLVRVFPALLLPLLPLPIWAVGVRRDQYGWTEFRYLRLLLLVALAVLAVWGTVRLVRRARPLLAAIPAVLAAALFLGAVGPWSAQAVSRRDQTARLRGALTAAGLMRDGRLTRTLLPPGTTSRAPTTLSPERFSDVRSSLDYLYGAHGVDAASRAMGTAVGGYGNSYTTLVALAVREGCRQEATRFYSASLPPGTPIPTERGTLYFIDSNVQTATPAPFPRVELKGTEFEFRTRGGTPLRARLGELARVLPVRTSGACEDYGRNTALSPSDAVVPLVDATGRTRGELVVTALNFGNLLRTGDGQGPGPLRVQHVQGIVIVRE